MQFSPFGSVVGYTENGDDKGVRSTLAETSFTLDSLGHHQV